MIPPTSTREHGLAEERGKIREVEDQSAKERGKEKMAKKIPINKIIVDPRVQPRSEMVQKAVDDYAEAMRNGETFPPIVVFKRDDDSYLLAHGFHRNRGAIQAGLETISAEIRTGDIHDAILFAAGANRAQSKVGLRFTNADKRRAVLMLLGDEKWMKRSDRWIAEQVGVSNKTVATLRPDVGNFPTSTREDKKGRQQPARKPKAKREEHGDEGTPTAERGGQPGAVDGEGVPEESAPPEKSGRSGHDDRGGKGAGPHDGDVDEGKGRTEVNWNEVFEELKKKIRALVREYETLEERLDSYNAEYADFHDLSGLEKEREELFKETMRIVSMADRTRSKFTER